MKKRILLAVAICCIAAGAIIAAITMMNKPDIQENKTFKITNTHMDNEIILPTPQLKGNMSVEEALQTRRSIRNYTDQSLSLQQVSQLLWATYGVTMVSGSGREYKTAPSAGATYPLEIYLMAGNVEGLPAGLYRYSPGKNSLNLEQSGDLRKQTTEACLGQKMISEAPVSIVFSAVYERTTSRYGNRGEERYVCMDLGHAAQNTYLQATAMGLGTCAVGAFEDDKLQKVLRLSEPEKVLYLMPVGYLK
jgi:SagB-type dehydrogenase family enzyme